MGIFDLLKSKPHQDPVLGILQHGRGRWRGSITLPPDSVVPLLLSGGRAGPDEASVLLARAPYRESLPGIEAPRDVWPHTKLERVLIEPMDGVPTVEIAYGVAWDEEHTVGAWVRDWRVFELCGSVGP